MLIQGVTRIYLTLKTSRRNIFAGSDSIKTNNSNASRGITGNSSVGHGNLFLENGPGSPGDLLRQAGTGLYVTELLGFGVNIANGDYSRGAVGLWIENGELAYPVEEITIAGNLLEMFQNIEVIGNDLELRGSITAPTLKIARMTIAGE